MEIEVLEPVTKAVSAIRIEVLVRDSQREQVSHLSGHYRAGVLRLELDIAERKVRGWKFGQRAEIHLKVVDTGRYTLLDPYGNSVKSLVGDYVPACLPGEHYGDYLILNIDANGRVAGFNPTALQVAADFFPTE